MAEGPLTDKVVLVTGGAHRIGAALGRRLHAEGMRLALHYRSSEAGALALQSELQRQRPRSVALVQGDLLGGEAVLRALVRETVAAFGRLDVLINNASSFYPTPVGEATEGHWRDLVGTNLQAPFFLSQAAAPQLREHHGCIVNMVDIHAERPLRDYPIYSAAKAGLIALTRSLARDLAPEVRVNAISPGAILWPEAGLDEATKERVIRRTPLRRIGDPEDIARTVLFLVRDAGYITGQVIAVDGGRSIAP